MGRTVVTQEYMRVHNQYRGHTTIWCTWGGLMGYKSTWEYTISIGAHNYLIHMGRTDVTQEYMRVHNQYRGYTAIWCTWGGLGQRSTWEYTISIGAHTSLMHMGRTEGTNEYMRVHNQYRGHITIWCTCIGLRGHRSTWEYTISIGAHSYLIHMGRTVATQEYMRVHRQYRGT